MQISQAEIAFRFVLTSSHRHNSERPNFGMAQEKRKRSVQYSHLVRGLTAALIAMGCYILSWTSSYAQSDHINGELANPIRKSIQKTDPQLENEPRLISTPQIDDITEAADIAELPFSYSIDTVGATVAISDPVTGCGIGQNSNTVWFSYTASFTGFIDIETTGSDYDTVLAVYAYDPAQSSLAFVGCNDDIADDGTSGMRVRVNTNALLYIQVADYGLPGGGLLRFSVDYSPINSLRNSYIEANVLAADNRGFFVIGTTGGEPETVLDDNKRLLFGYPGYFGTSYTTMRVANDHATHDYAMGYDVYGSSAHSSAGNTVSTVWSVDGIQLTQNLSFATNADIDRQDTVVIEYQIENNSDAVQRIGLRILLDTMIGDNDGAPLFVPGKGRVTTEQEFRGKSVPEYWIAWESPTFDEDSLKARGSLSGSNISTPDRVIIGHWDESLCENEGEGLYSSLWEYEPNDSTTILCDSAIALYFEPESLQPGESRTIRTSYGLVASAGGISLAPAVNEYIRSNQDHLAQVRDATTDVTIVGDYFLDKRLRGEIERIANGVFNAAELFTAGIKWSLISRGASHIATPGYKAGLNASWRGWVDDDVAKHFYKPLYDAIHNNRELVLKETLRSGIRYFGREIAEQTVKEVEKEIIELLVPGPDDDPVADNNPVADNIGDELVALGDRYISELGREQDDMLAQLAVESLTEQEVESYQVDLTERTRANAMIVDAVGSQRGILWSNYEMAVEDESRWWNVWGPALAKWVVIGGATLAFDGPGFYVASLGTAAVSTVYDGVQDTRAIEHDKKMFDMSLRFLDYRSSTAYMQISQNSVNGLNVIRSDMTPLIPSGEVIVSAQQSYGHYRLWPKLFWAEESSQIVLQVHNDESMDTSFYSSAVYTHEKFWSGTESFFVEGRALDLPGQQEGFAEIPLKMVTGGESPEMNEQMEIWVLGGTDTGLYPIANFGTAWSPDRLETGTIAAAELTEQFSGAQLDSAPALPFPVTSYIRPILNTTDYRAVLSIYNPFDIAVSSAITQPIPAEFSVIETDGTRVADDLHWQVALEPGQGIELYSRLSWNASLGTTVNYPSADIRFTASDNSGGDIYITADRQVAAPWILKVDQDLPLGWQTDEQFTLTLTIENISSDIHAEGQFLIEIDSIEGASLFRFDETLDIMPGESQNITLPISINDFMGYLTVTETIQLNSVERQVLREIIRVKGRQQYLPAISNN